MDEAGFPLHFGGGFAGLEGLDAWMNRGLVANWIVTNKDTWNGGETQRQKGPAQQQGWHQLDKPLNLLYIKV